MSCNDYKLNSKSVRICIVYGNTNIQTLSYKIMHITSTTATIF